MRRVTGGEGKVGEKDEEFESYPWVVVGGAEVVGGGRSWALHGGRWPGVELGGGGASLAMLGGRSRTEELRWGEAKLVEGSIWGGKGRDGGSTRGQGRGGANVADDGSRPL